MPDAPNDEALSSTISTVALAFCALVIMFGVVLFAVGPGAKFNAFVEAHPFDVLTVAIWYSGGAWLLGNSKRTWAVIGLIYGLSIAALVCLLVVDPDWGGAMEWTLGIATLIAIVVWLIFQGDSGGSNGGRLRSALRSEDPLLIFGLMAGAALYFEYNTPPVKWLPFTGLVAAVVGAVIVSRMIQTRGYRPGRTVLSLKSIVTNAPATGAAGGEPPRVRA